MSNEAFVALMDEAYNFIVSVYLDRMLETSVSALNMNKNYVEGEETDFKKWAAELYRSYFKKWAADLYRKQMEGENE